MNLANLLSLVRLGCTPIIVWQIINHNYKGAGMLFTAAAISDFLDGILARSLSLSTRLGAYIDPLADKILLSAVFIALGSQNLIPFWLVSLIVARDILIVFGITIIWLKKKSIIIEPILLSKINTFLQMIFITIILGQEIIDYKISSFTFNLLCLMVLMSLMLSGSLYLYYYWSSLVKTKK